MNKQDRTRAAQDDYLWDGNGTLDAEIQHLERALERLRSANLVPPAFPRIEPAKGLSSWRLGITSVAWVPRFAAATLLGAALISGVLLSRLSSSSSISWDVELTATSPAGGNAKAEPPRKSHLRVGETFETNSASTATISVAEVGRLDIEPLTRLRLLQSGEGRKRIALDRGTIHAAIWAPPGEFVVDTPSATAVDLGCMYTLQVDESGSGLLRTTLGWVGFRSSGREAFIPAGAAAATHAQSGPGTPYFEDASDEFRSTLAQFDVSSDRSAHHAALEIILREARVHDGLTLWHLLTRADTADRVSVFDRLARLVPPPDGVTREGVLRLDRGMLDSWWNALDLGDISLWRHWEQTWNASAGVAGQHSR